MNIEYKGGFIFADGERYICSEKAERELSGSKNQREYVELAELLAYRVFEEKTRENDGLFIKCGPQSQ